MTRFQRECDREVRRLRKAAAKYPTPEAFVEALDAGELIRKGDFVRDRDLIAASGFVIGESWITRRKIPVWIVRKGDGREEVVFKSEAVHVHGFANPACLHPGFKWPEQAA